MAMLMRRGSSLLAAGRTAASGQLRGILTATLPDLDYDYGALEPVIDGQIMQLHHSKHHATYVANFNKAQEQYAEAEAKGDIAKMIGLQGALKFNGGGHVNHTLFFKHLIPPKDFELPSGALAAAIDDEFGSLDGLVTKFNAAGAALQGSGWTWLGLNKETGRLVIETTANQDPLSTKGLIPLYSNDCWEHSYYLQYQNRRPDYLKASWQVVNWAEVGKRFEAAK